MMLESEEIATRMKLNGQGNSKMLTRNVVCNGSSTTIVGNSTQEYKKRQNKWEPQKEKTAWNDGRGGSRA